MIKRLKTRWNITSNLQLLVILFIFSITGTTTLYVRKFIFDWIGVSVETSLWIKTPLYLIVIFPAYQMLFLLFGALFGQFNFAWGFQKKMLSRFRIRK